MIIKKQLDDTCTTLYSHFLMSKQLPIFAGKLFSHFIYLYLIFQLSNLYINYYIYKNENVSFEK